MMSKKVKMLKMQFITLCLLVFSFSITQADVTLTVGKGSGTVHPTDAYPVEVSLENQYDQVTAVQVDVCDVDDYLSLAPDDHPVYSCETTDRTSGFMCATNEKPNGCSAVILISLGGAVIEAGEGAIFTLNHNVKDGTPYEQCRDLNPENVMVADAGGSMNVTLESGAFCFPCTSNADCNDGLYCNGAETCAAGECIPGTDQCTDMLCDERNDMCAESCIEDLDCDDGLYCTGEGTCLNGYCQPGNNPCAQDLMCDDAIDACVNCLDDADCDDGEFCNGAETCVDGECQQGGDPCSDDGLYCTGVEGCDEDSDVCTQSGDPCAPEGVCNEEDDLCNCSQNADCDDGLYCTGEETCSDGVCQSGSNPCSAGTTCNEATDACVTPPPPPPPPPPGCTSDADCDDGEYCNGEETCQGGACQAGTDPCEPLLCDEETDECVVDCLTDEDCDDGVYCNGDEICMDGECQQGDDPCPDDGMFCNGIESCDEGNDECLSSGNPCSSDETCNEEDDVCESPSPPPLSFKLIPKSALRSHLIPLPLYLFIVSDDDDTTFDNTTAVSFEGDAIRSPWTLVLSENLIYVFSMIAPAGPGVSGSIDVEVKVTTDEGEGIETLELNVLPFFLDELREKLKGEAI